MKLKMRAYGDKVYTNFCGLNVPEYGVQCESSTIISIEFLLNYENKFFLQVYLNNCAYRIWNMKMIDYLDNYLCAFYENKLFILINGSCECFVTIEYI